MRRRFASAVKFARQILLDPEMHAAYQTKAQNGKPPFIIALADFMNFPSVEEIEANDYTGKPGDLIRVHAIDDFKVTHVRVTITNSSGEVIESGPCQPDDSGIWWVYTATEPVATLPGVNIIAIARDIPGHTGEKPFTF